MDDIGSPSVEEFLDKRSAEDPRAVLELMRKRVEDAEGGRDSKRFHPMPYAWHRPLALREHPEFLTILRELLAWLGDGSSWRRRMHGEQIFMAAVGTFDDSVLSLLLETLRTGGEAAREQSPLPSHQARRPSSSTTSSSFAMSWTLQLA